MLMTLGTAIPSGKVVTVAGVVVVVVAGVVVVVVVLLEVVVVVLLVVRCAGAARGAGALPHEVRTQATPRTAQQASTAPP
jgi:hypothetical protein